MSKKHAAKTEKAREALDEHIRVTEEGLRALNGLKAEQVERLVRFVKKSSRKLQDKLDGNSAFKDRNE
jgi:hypothetical protein